MDDMYLFKSQDEGNRMLYAYYKGEFWFFDPNVQQWYISGHVREQYELEAQKVDGLTPDDFTCTGYGYEFVAEYEVPVAVLDALRAAKKVLPPETASVEVPLPKPGDMYRSPKSGQLYKIDELTNGKKTCYLTMRSNAQGGTWVPVNSSVYPKLSDAQGEFEAWIRTEQLEPVAPTGDAAATTAASAVPMPSTAAGTTTTSASGADAGSFPNALTAPQPTEGCADIAANAPSSLPAFDYSGLPADTAEHLQNLARRAAQAKQRYILDMMEIVVEAHRELCGVVAPCDNSKHGNRGDSTFRAWCASIGVGKDTAYRLLQVQALMDGSTPEEQEVLADAPAKLLYAAAKPSAPAELVQAVKDGDITTHKQYQDLLARYNAEKAAREQAEHEASLDRKEQEDANAAALRYKNECDRRAQDQRRLEGLVSTAQGERDAALQRATAAESRAAGAQKLADQRGAENTDLRRKLKEAESRPVDIAVAEPSEADKEHWRKEGEDRMAATLQDAVLKAHKAKIAAENQVADLQEQLAASRPDADACQRTADTLYETTENLRLLLRAQLKLAQLQPKDYGNVVAHVLQAAQSLRDTVRSCAPVGYTMDDDDEEDFL